MAQLSGEQTLNEAQYIQELKLAAGKFLTRIHSLIHSLTHSLTHTFTQTYHILIYQQVLVYLIMTQIATMIMMT